MKRAFLVSSVMRVPCCGVVTPLIWPSFIDNRADEYMCLHLIVSAFRGQLYGSFHAVVVAGLRPYG